MRFFLASFLCSMLLGQTLNIETYNHTVKEGESLSSISEGYGVSWASIYHLNAHLIGVDADQIKEGHTLNIPLNSYYTAEGYHFELRAFLCLFALFIFLWNIKPVYKHGSVHTKTIIDRQSNSAPAKSRENESTHEVAIEAGLGNTS